MRVGRIFAHSWSPVTYLDHDHSEGENVRLFAIWPFIQYLWCNPSQGGTVLRQGGRLRIHVCVNRSKTKIRDPRMTGSIDTDV